MGVSNRAFALLLAVFAGILLVKWMKSGCQWDILWTCTSFFDYNKGERWTAFQDAMDSIVRTHSSQTLEKIQKWIVLNEYSPHPKHDYGAIIAKKYPWITFIQKPAGHEGISNSINMILDSYVPYSRLWIHWEETWVVRAPFLDRAISFMNTQPEITQLTFVYKNGRTEWSDINPERLKCSDVFCVVKPHTDIAWYDTWDGSAERMTDEAQSKWAITWPLYQLLPSINRSAFYNTRLRFHPYRKHAEWLFAREWLRAGGKKAIFRNAPVWRPTESSHVSTHD
jgi:hypothetical protein